MALPMVTDQSAPTMARDGRRGGLRSLPPGLLRPPRLRAVEERAGERHATWFELFFDLVFVVAVAELAHLLVEDTSLRGFVRYLLLFVPVWWIWILFTFYADRFDTDDVVYRLMGMLGMAAIIAMGITLPGAMAEGSAARLDAPFVASYLAARWVTFLLYLRAARIPYGRRLVWIHGTTSVISTLIWLGSLLVPAPERYALWVAALAIELGAPLVGRRTIAAVPVTLDHLPERVGLFTIIVLGESVVAVATGLGDVGWSVRSTLVALAAFGLACCVWWVNFDFADSGALRRRFSTRQVYVYGHFPIVAGLTAVGAGALLAIEHATDDHLAAGARWAICGGLALYLLALTSIHLAALESSRRGLGQFRPVAIVTAIALGLAAFGEGLPPVVLVGVLVGAVGTMVGRKVLWVAAAGAPAGGAASETAVAGAGVDGSA